jgi:hypothetical protein
MIIGKDFFILGLPLNLVGVHDNDTGRDLS